MENKKKKEEEEKKVVGKVGENRSGAGSGTDKTGAVPETEAEKKEKARKAEEDAKKEEKLAIVRMWHIAVLKIKTKEASQRFRSNKASNKLCRIIPKWLGVFFVQYRLIEEENKLIQNVTEELCKFYIGNKLVTSTEITDNKRILKEAGEVCKF